MILKPGSDVKPTKGRIPLQNILKEVDSDNIQMKKEEFQHKQAGFFALLFLPRNIQTRFVIARNNVL